MDHLCPDRTDIPETGFDDEQAPAAPCISAGAADRDGDRLDFFIHRGDQIFAGVHLIIDLEDASRIDDADYIETTLIQAAKAAGATVLNSDFHVFTPNNGVSGVVILAESHISIHTWPERNFAALDVFMCGACDPMRTIPVFKTAFQPNRMGLQEIKRGLRA